jgi:hypothetical protein
MLFLKVMFSLRAFIPEPSNQKIFYRRERKERREQAIHLEFSWIATVGRPPWQ